MKTNCQAEIDACLADGQPVGTALDPSAVTPGNVPASLVGSWVHAAYGATERFKFNADGTGYYQSGLTSTSTCAVTQDTVWDGTVNIEATTITVNATTVTNTRFECGQKSVTTDSPTTLHFSYLYNTAADTLSTLDSNCAAKYPDSPSSQALYCKNDFARE